MAKTIVIFSTKGGVGKTLVASNLAVSLAKDEMQRVCLIDLDLQVVGDMARMLDLNPKKSMVDLLSFIKDKEIPPDDKTVDGFLVNNSYGVDFLPAVLHPSQAPNLEPSRIKDVFKLLDKKYDYIVVDGGKAFNNSFLAVLNQANLILLIVAPDALSLYQTKSTLDTFGLLHLPSTMTKLVLNRAEATSSISWQEIKATLPIDIIAKIPSEGKTVGLAVNQGIPVVVDSPKSRVTKAIKDFANDLVVSSELFVSHVEIDQLQLKETLGEKLGEFWQRLNLTAESQEGTKVAEEIDSVSLLKRRVHNRLIKELDLKKLELKVFSDPQKIKELRNKAEGVVTNLILKEAGSFISSQEERARFVKEILDEALGLGPLEDLLADNELTDIMVNNKDEIYVERHGKIELTKKKFISNEQVKIIIERIIAPIGRRIDESVPMVDARLADGSRVNAIIQPLSLTGPTLTIRKFRKERYKTQDLIALGALDNSMAEFIKACVVTRKNIIVSGGTGSGKTTVLNVLSEHIPDTDRIITIEDAAELKLQQEHWIRLESRPPNIEGKGAITIRDLFRNTLRMRPDRIVIGECRGVETLDMLQAMNTGHDGSMTTIHANSTHDVLTRIDSMILMSGVELPIRAISEMVASAVNIVVHTARLSDGTRKIICVTEITGMKDEHHVGLKDIFVFQQTGIGKQGNVLGSFQPTGYIPKAFEEMKIKGIPVSDTIFKPQDAQ